MDTQNISAASPPTDIAGGAESRIDPVLKGRDSILERIRRLEGGGVRTFATPDPLVVARGEGAWLYDPDGRAYLDFAGSFAAPATWGDSEAIIRLTGMPSTLARTGAYFPARWKQVDIDDQDFGASSVMLLNVPGATPEQLRWTLRSSTFVEPLERSGRGEP